MIRKFKMFVGILMIWWIIQRGRLEEILFTLYLFGTSRWKVKWTLNEIFFLFGIKWLKDIGCVLRMIRSRCISEWIYTRKIRDNRIIKDVRKSRRMHGQNGVILQCGFLFIFLHTLFMNDSAGYLHDTNSIDNLILMNTRCGVQNGRTQHSTIWRINGTWGQRLREWIHVTTNKLANQIYVDIESKWGGRML